MRPAPPLTSMRHPPSPRVVGRYLMYEEISCGGMASVHFGRLSSDAGFSRTVAIKYLHPQYARDAQFISMFLDEARLVSRIRHPNVAAPLDVVVVSDSEEVFLVMEYIHGETLGRLIEESHRLRLPLPPNVCANILCVPKSPSGSSNAYTLIVRVGESAKYSWAPSGLMHRPFEIPIPSRWRRSSLPAPMEYRQPRRPGCPSSTMVPHQNRPRRSTRPSLNRMPGLISAGRASQVTDPRCGW